MAQHGPTHRPNIGQHGPNIGPTWPQDGPNIAQHRPNLGQYRPKMGPTWLNMGTNWPNISPRWAQDGSTWARLGPTWAQPALNIGPDCFHTGKHCALCLPQFNIALPGFARRISAQSSHTIRQKSLLGRRPAVRRMPFKSGVDLFLLVQVTTGSNHWALRFCQRGHVSPESSYPSLGISVTVSPHFYLLLFWLLFSR